MDNKLAREIVAVLPDNLEMGELAEVLGAIVGAATRKMNWPEHKLREMLHCLSFSARKVYHNHDASDASTLN